MASGRIEINEANLLSHRSVEEEVNVDAHARSPRWPSLYAQPWPDPGS